MSDDESVTGQHVESPDKPPAHIYDKMVLQALVTKPVRTDTRQCAQLSRRPAPHDRLGIIHSKLSGAQRV